MASPIENHRETIDKLSGALSEEQVKAGVSAEDLADSVTHDQLSELRQAVTKVNAGGTFTERTQAQLRLDQLRLKMDTHIKRLQEQMDKDPENEGLRKAYDERMKLREELDKSREGRGVLDSGAGEIFTTAKEIFEKRSIDGIDSTRLTKITAAVGAVISSIWAATVNASTGIMGMISSGATIFFDKIRDLLPARLRSFIPGRSGEVAQRELHESLRKNTESKVKQAESVPTPATTDAQRKTVREAIAAVDAERKSLSDLTKFPQADRSTLEQRRKDLDDQRAQLLQKVPEVAKKEQAEKKEAEAKALTPEQLSWINTHQGMMKATNAAARTLTAMLGRPYSRVELGTGMSSMQPLLRVESDALSDNAMLNSLPAGMQERLRDRLAYVRSTNSDFTTYVQRLRNTNLAPAQVEMVRTHLNSLLRAEEEDKKTAESTEKTGKEAAEKAASVNLLNQEAPLTVNGVSYRVRANSDASMTVNGKRWKLVGVSFQARNANFSITQARLLNGDRVEATIVGAAMGLSRTINVAFSSADLGNLLPRLANTNANIRLDKEKCDGHDIDLRLS